MRKAKSLWASDPICPADSPLVPKTGRCNGTGIGSMGGCESGTTCANPTAWYEWFRAWQQLADAGMIDGAFTGVSLGGSGNIRAWLGSNQSNVPASKIKGGGYTLRYFKDS